MHEYIRILHGFSVTPSFLCLLIASEIFVVVSLSSCYSDPVQPSRPCSPLPATVRVVVFTARRVQCHRFLSLSNRRFELRQNQGTGRTYLLQYYILFVDPCTKTNYYYEAFTALFTTPKNWVACTTCNIKPSRIKNITRRVI